MSWWKNHLSSWRRRFPRDLLTMGDICQTQHLLVTIHKVLNGSKITAFWTWSPFTDQHSKPSCVHMHWQQWSNLSWYCNRYEGKFQTRPSFPVLKTRLKVITSTGNANIHSFLVQYEFIISPPGHTRVKVRQEIHKNCCPKYIRHDLFTWPEAAEHTSYSTYSTNQNQTKGFFTAFVQERKSLVATHHNCHLKAIQTICLAIVQQAWMTGTSRY